MGGGGAASIACTKIENQVVWPEYYLIFFLPENGYLKNSRGGGGLQLAPWPVYAYGNMYIPINIPSDVMYVILLISKGPTTTSSAILLVPFTKFCTIIFYYHISCYFMLCILWLYLYNL